MKPLKDTSLLGRNSRRGLNKKWLFQGKMLKMDLHYDYLQKINYSVQDFNSIVENGENFSREKIVYLIILVVWIDDALQRVMDCYDNSITADFVFPENGILHRYHCYLMALRSFVVAHPLRTDRHKDMGLNGNLVCIDIHSRSKSLNLYNGDLFQLTPNGMIKITRIPQDNVFLSVYAKDDGAKFTRQICFDLNDVRDTAALNLKKLDYFDRFLGKLKRKNS